MIPAVISYPFHGARPSLPTRLAAGLLLLACGTGCESASKGEPPGSLDSSRTGTRGGGVPTGSKGADDAGDQGTAGAGAATDASDDRDGAVPNTCGQACTSDADCNPGQLCVELLDATQCTPKECAGCTGVCDYDFTTCTIEACFTGVFGVTDAGAEPPRATPLDAGCTCE